MELRKRIFLFCKAEKRPNKVQTRKHSGLFSLEKAAVPFDTQIDKMFRKTPKYKNNFQLPSLKKNTIYLL